MKLREKIEWMLSLEPALAHEHIVEFLWDRNLRRLGRKTVAKLVNSLLGEREQDIPAPIFVKLLPIVSPYLRHRLIRRLCQHPESTIIEVVRSTKEKRKRNEVFAFYVSSRHCDRASALRILSEFGRQMDDDQLLDFAHRAAGRRV